MTYIIRNCDERGVRNIDTDAIVETDVVPDEYITDIITILQKNTADMTQNEDEIAETLRISLRRYVSQTLGLQPKTTVHVTCLDV